MLELTELSISRDKALFQPLLDAGGLRLPARLTCLYGAFGDGILVGCCGRLDNVIQCAAVSPETRGEGVLSALVSQLVTDIRMEGYGEAFVFTRPGSVPRFLPLGFSLLASTADAAFLCTRSDAVARWVRRVPPPAPESILPGRPYAHGCIVMNANPFTLGHQFLVRQAAEKCGFLTVLVVEADVSRFPFAHRLNMVRAGVAAFSNVQAVPAGPFAISLATFPTYFLKEPSHGAAVHGALDAALFAEQVAPALGVDARFVGSEPLDPMTEGYRAALAAALPPGGIALETVERFTLHGEPVSASRVRALLDAGQTDAAKALTPESTWPYLT